MKELTLRVEAAKRIKKQVYLLGIKSSYLSRHASPGQFIHIKVDSKVTILRRPFSIHKVRGSIVYFLFKVRGRGTYLLSQFKRGDKLNIVGPLGEGFSFRNQPAHEAGASGGKSVTGPLMRRAPLAENQGGKDRLNIFVAGGIGVAPLVFLAEKLRLNQKAERVVLLGVKTEKEILCEGDFRKLGYKVHIATEDGSRGIKGTVTGLLKNILATRYSLPRGPNPARTLRGLLATHLYACGPGEMFAEIKKVVKKYPGVQCQVSFEQFMGCGLGICYGCSIATKKGYKKVCKDGPVFDLNEVC